MTAPAVAVTRRPPTEAPQRPGDAEPLCAAIARVADEQFHRWRPGGRPALTETSPAAAPLLREYYRVGVGVAVTDAQLRDPAFQAARPWSAVFVSSVMRTAGAGPAFRYSPAHQTYIRAARRSRLDGDPAARFWAYRATEVAPRVGDLVCAARAGSGATYDNIGEARSRATHCDVVTEVVPGRIRVIGGNVGQTVGAKWLRTRPDGRLDLSGGQSTLFAVVRCREGGSTRAPAPAPQPGRRQRVRRVMALLTNRYGYPVGGVAGLVGNLLAESELLPNRVEGSSAATPMRAPNLSAQVDHLVTELRRDFPQLDRTLRSPGLSTARAADAVLLRFLRPRPVLDRPLTDPVAQAALRRRRQLAAEARQIHTASIG